MNKHFFGFTIGKFEVLLSTSSFGGTYPSIHVISLDLLLMVLYVTLVTFWNVSPAVLIRYLDWTLEKVAFLTSFNIWRTFSRSLSEISSSLKPNHRNQVKLIWIPDRHGMNSEGSLYFMNPLFEYQSRT